MINSQIHYNLIVIFICNVFCIYKKLFEKINVTSEGLSIRHETQCNVKSEVFNCLMYIVAYSSTLKHFKIIAHSLEIIINRFWYTYRYRYIDIDRYRYN